MVRKFSISLAVVFPLLGVLAVFLLPQKDNVVTCPQLTQPVHYEQVQSQDDSIFTSLSTISASNIQNIHILHEFSVAERVTAISISESGTILVAGLQSGAIRWWDLQRGTTQTISLYSHDTVKDMVFSPSHSLIATYSYRGNIRLWNTATRTEVGNFTLDISLRSDEYHALVFIEDTTVAYTHKATVYVCNLTTGEGYKASTRKPTSSFGVDRQRHVLVFGTIGDNDSLGTPQLGTWDLDDRDLDTQGAVHAANNIIYYDGSLYATRFNIATQINEQSASANIYAVDQLDAVVSTEQGDVIFLAGTIDGEVNTLIALNSDTLQPIHALGIHSDKVEALGINTTGNVLVSGSVDGVIRVWGIRP